MMGNAIILKKTPKFVKDHQKTTLSLTDAKKFIEILEKSEEPNEALKSAMERFRNRNKAKKNEYF